MINIAAIGVREGELPLYKEENNAFKYNINYYCNDHDIYDEKIYDGVDFVISSDSTRKLTKEYFGILKKHNIKLFVAKMTGVAQIDMEAARENNVHVANVQGYSPNAIAELSLTLAMMLERNICTIELANKHRDFKLNYPYFNEIRDLTVGVYGVGRIGSTTAKLFSDIGSKVIGFDPHPYEPNKEFMEYVSMEQLKTDSDILILHSPYIKGVNYHIIDGEFIKGMKDGAVIVNVARGELVDLKAINENIINGKLKGYATDVLENEQIIYGKKVSEIDDVDINEAINLYPKVIVTPHIGAHTIRARKSQIEIALSEIKEYIETGSCKFLIE